MTITTAPNLSEPLIHEPQQSSPAAPTSALGPLEHLVGTWTNQNLPNQSTGGTSSPYSYNVMPLPQTDTSGTPTGYILKNFSYYEELTFSAIHGNAPNRGGIGTQVANTVFYEQRVYFAEGPAKDQLVHAENGSLLFLSDSTQLLGPYGNGDQPGLGNQTVPDSMPPTQAHSIVKQVSVPHGNSILAVGDYSVNSGTPIIAAPSQVLPKNVNTQQYQTVGVGNPNVSFTNNPNLPLTNALALQPVDNFIKLSVSNDTHPISNIGFEQQHAKVTRYSVDYWLESLSSGGPFTQLQYSQTIMMDIPLASGVVQFPHITTNTLTKV